MGCLVVNLIIFILCLPRAILFRLRAGDTAATQRAILKRTIRRNRTTQFGRKNLFAAPCDVERFQEIVPLSDYDDYGDYIEQLLQGEQDVLTTQDATNLVPTGGSTGGRKCIPYNRQLQKELRAGVYVWLADLYLHCPALFFGKAYWSITPAFQPEVQRGKICQGFREDTEYLGGTWKRLFAKIFPVPPEVAAIADVDQFRYATALFLLKERNLALVSIWNPSFLTILLSFIQRHFKDLIRDLRTGRLTGTPGFEPKLRNRLEKSLKANPERADEVEDLVLHDRAFNTSGNLWTEIWPRLRVISCWEDANASEAARHLRETVPGVVIQGKGLLATEGIVTFPLTSARGHVLSILSHFFEFIEIDPLTGVETHPAILAHQVKTGHSYSVAITTGGGLYRYRLRDIVRVQGFYHSCPVLEFRGKEDHISDYMGEKLNERHVANILRRAFAARDISPRFTLLAPEWSGEGLRYALFVESGVPPEDIARASLHSLMRDVESGLQENFHYSYCRKLEQIQPPVLYVLRSMDRSASDLYLNGCAARGQRLGDIKPSVLNRETGWKETFHPIIDRIIEKEAH